MTSQQRSPTMTAPAAPHIAAPPRALAAGDAAEVLALAVTVSLGLLLAILLVGSAGLMLGAPLGAWLLPVSLIACFAGLVRLRAAAERPQLLTALGLAAALWLGSILLAGSVYDWSWDGQHYHQELILRLAEGWNPVWERFVAAERGLSDGEISLWLNHYPKGLATIGTAVYALTGGVETAKFVNPLLMALVGLYAAALLKQLAGLSWLWSGLLGAALAGNAVAGAQMLSFYNDGAIFCGVALVMLSGAHFLARPGAAPLIALAGAVLITATIKFTGLVFAIGVLGFLGMIALARAQGGLADRVRAVLPLAGVFAALVFLSLIALGPSPYLQNIWTGGHPFFPLAGEGSFDIVSRSTPQAFKDLSGPARFLASLVGAPEGGVARYETRDLFAALPTAEEMKTLAWVDPRIGGWGPLFAEQLVIAIFGAAALLIFARDKWTAGLGALGLFAALALTLVNPGAWWARYSSYLLIGPWCVFTAAAILGRARPFGGARMLAALGLVFMLGANLPVLWWATAKAYKVSARTEEQIGYIKASKGPVTLSTGLFHANRVKLFEAGIDAKIVTRARDLPCEKPIPFYNGHWISQACY